MVKHIYTLRHDVLSHTQRMAIVDSIQREPFFGASALGVEFIGTKGFSLVFKRSCLDIVTSRFRYLAPVLDAALFDECNAFYVNPLILYKSSAVEAHVDCRLSPDGGRIIPNLVSVYYAEIDPHMRGGELVFRPDTPDELRIRPKSGDLVHFVGSTIHRVEPVSTAGVRVSIVCEQYNLDPEQLNAFALCEVLTSGLAEPRLNAMHTTSSQLPGIPS